MIRLNKRCREMEDFSKQQKLQISLNYNVCQDEADRSASTLNPNTVSTGLRLSFDDDEHNSSITSAPAIILSLGDNVRTELDRQKEELDQYIMLQKEQLSKGVRDIKQKHSASLLAAIAKGINKKLREKDAEIENMNHKGRELAERIKHVAMEAQNWHHRAKYNESVINVLKNNLQQAISQGAEQRKEGLGDSEVDDAASHIDPNNLLCITGPPVKFTFTTRQHGGGGHLICRVCKAKEISMLVMPSRHLCLCKD